MAKLSAGLLVFRDTSNGIEVLLVHPGGPFWAKKDEGSWSIPKGEFGENEQPQAAAMREFTEETGSEIKGQFIPLKPLHQPGGKMVYAFAVMGDFDPSRLKSNTFILEWPPKSGRKQEFPEIDRAGWFSIKMAMKKILVGQQGFIIELQEILGRFSN